MMKRIMNLMISLWLLSILTTGTVQAEPKADDYLLPETAIRVYNYDEIGTLPIDLTCYAKNEVYARHGRKFVSAELDSYFRSQSWYQPSIKPENFSESLLNSNEQENVARLAARERSLSYDGSGYKLDQVGYENSVQSHLQAYFSEDLNICRSLSAHMTSGMKVVNSSYFSFSMPAEPSTGILQQDRRSFFIYYPTAREQGYGGLVVTVRVYDRDSQENNYSNLPSWGICGTSSDYIFVAIYPTDVQYNPNDATQAAEYRKLQEWAKDMQMQTVF